MKSGARREFEHGLTELDEIFNFDLNFGMTVLVKFSFGHGQATSRQNFYINIVRTAWEAYSVKVEFGHKLIIFFRAEEYTKTLDRVGWSEDLPDAY
jgi:hypothetical protein